MFCKGPDEYCGITNNNLFTNCMVKFNLDLAIRISVSSSAVRKWVLKRISKQGKVKLTTTSAWAVLQDGIEERSEILSFIIHMEFCNARFV